MFKDKFKKHPKSGAEKEALSCYIPLWCDLFLDAGRYFDIEQYNEAHELRVSRQKS